MGGRGFEALGWLVVPGCKMCISIDVLYPSDPFGTRFDQQFLVE